MGALVGIFAKRSEGVDKLIENMLLALRHRGSQTELARKESVGSFETAIGCRSHHSVEACMAESKETILALAGSIFERSQRQQASFLHRLVSKTGPRKGIAEWADKPGAFALLCHHQKRLYAFRDLMGLKPLFYARDGTTTAFASERKALWQVGLTRIDRVLPGCLYTAHSAGTSAVRLAHLRRCAAEPMTIEEAASRLRQLLIRSVRRITRGTDRFAVAFSGGLDSSLTAALAKRAGSTTEMVSVGLSGSPELSSVEKYAKQLGLPIRIETFSLDCLEEYVRRVLWLIEEPNLMKVSVAVPLHWAAKVAAERGFKVMLYGQGSDELYGGYYRYARILDTQGRKKLEAELQRNTVEGYLVNYERDDQATSPFAELRSPFTDLDVVQFSLRIPSDLKVKLGNDLTRKWVLRKVAKTVGLPDDIVWRRKKAIQHGTGVENAIRKLAKERNLTTEEYLEKIHAEVIMRRSMP